MTRAARCKSGSASRTARRASRVSFQPITMWSALRKLTDSGTTSAGRPILRIAWPESRTLCRGAATLSYRQDNRPPQLASDWKLPAGSGRPSWRKKKNPQSRNASHRRIPKVFSGGRRAHNPRVTSAQRKTVLLFRNSMTAGSIVAGRSCGNTTVATIMSQRSLKATDNAVLTPGLRPVRV